MRLIDADALSQAIQKEQVKLETCSDPLWELNKPIWKGLTYARRMIKDAPTIMTIDDYTIDDHAKLVAHFLAENRELIDTKQIKFMED